MNTDSKTKILCVDDESRVLDGLRANLRRKYQVETATSAAEALNKIEMGDHNFAAIISDMRMPHMNGATFLKKARDKTPNSTRILLTGFSEVDSAIQAVNEGGIFRFLTKPCAPDMLGKTLEEAVQLHQAIEAEKELLENTLKESLKAVCQVLAMVHPEAYGRALRIERLLGAATKNLPIEGWELSIAAMLSQLGWAVLDKESLSRALCGEIDQALQQKIDQAKDIPITLFEKIPRIESIKVLLKASVMSPSTEGPLAQRLLRASIALDDALCRSKAASEAIKVVHREHGADVAAALEQALNENCSGRPALLSVEGLKPGMVLEQDLKNQSGALILPSGILLTQAMVSRLKSMKKNMLPKQISVRVVTIDNSDLN